MYMETEHIVGDLNFNESFVTGTERLIGHSLSKEELREYYIAQSGDYGECLSIAIKKVGPSPQHMFDNWAYGARRILKGKTKNIKEFEKKVLEFKKEKLKKEAAQDAKNKKGEEAEYKLFLKLRKKFE
jgi:hypothetical protein